MTRLLTAGTACLVLVAILVTRPFAAVPTDIVLHAGSFTETHGNWALVESPTSPDRLAMASQEQGWSTRQAPLAAPADYVQAQFTAAANTPYRVWLRLRATADSKWNDSVWVQFDDAVDEAGAARFAAGTTDGLLVNLESCYACGDRGWGWQDHAWWTGQRAVVQFATAGPHTIRIQTREDGVALDQVVLSPASFFDRAPGPERDDATVVPVAAASAATAAPPPVPAAPPLSAASPAPAEPAPVTAQGAVTSTRDFAAIAWNVNIARQEPSVARQEIGEIAALVPRPAIVVLEEARGSLFSTYVGELQSRTGQPWGGVFQGHCAPGAWDENAGTCRKVEDEGVAILSTFPLTGKDTKLLPYADCWHSARAAVHAVLDVSGSPIHVYGTHLQTGTCTDVTTARLNSIAALKMWTSRSSGPALVAGDFNEIPGAPEFTDPGAGMLSAFVDAWAQAGAGAGLTYPVPSPDRRIDFWFVDRSGAVGVTSARVVTSAGESDHYPVVVGLQLQR